MAIALQNVTKPSFYQKVIFGLFSKMRVGRLTLTLSDGEIVQFGDTYDASFSADIQINDPKFFKRCVLYGDIGFGESYVDGDWDTTDITQVIKWFLVNIDNAPTVSGTRVKSIYLNILKVLNKTIHSKRINSLTGSKKNIAVHYDLHNDFFALFLDPTMTYSAAFYKQENMTLQEAQFAKYDRLCKQLHLTPNDHVLEIGSGWGANAIYMAKNYGCRVTTLTISEEQYKLAGQRVAAENLNDKVEVILRDYRLIQGKYDKIVSIEMLEAVGDQFYDTYFKKCSDLLKQNGILALQVITCPDSRFENLRNGVDWIQKHIFPGSLLPSVGAINNAINKVCDLTLVDLKDLGLDYERTLSAWHKQFNENIDEVKKLGFTNEFIRKWNYYFCYCEAAFSMRNINVMQMIYTRPNNTVW
jgi:cyclopropane-fatty-acyl-phospholipid synthase